MKAALVIGTRPQIIKSAPIIHAAHERSEIDLQVVHTGQHYDYEMSRVFFNELDLPDPIVNLGVGSGSHAWQTGKMMMGLEKAFIDLEPDVVLVPGDTNSTLAAALASVKLHIPVAHVEAGARSFDMRMPEEINRRLTDHCSSLLFAVSGDCVRNLLREGIAREQIFLVGDTMYESLRRHLPDVLTDNALEELGLTPNGYAVLTVHRPENVDDPPRLREVMEALMGLKGVMIVFPCHPRTENRLGEIGLFEEVSRTENIRLVKPVGYLRMLNLIKHARMVFTDSGGIQKEAFWLETPCITLRDSTEWVETIEMGVNTLVGSDLTSIRQSASRILYEKNISDMFSEALNPYDAGGAADKILESLIISSYNHESCNPRR